ncbi:aldehyde dehydrogenase [Terrabacter sp. Root85]|uniref:phenylacetic acid degradation protein PaaN n=1 Tax=unclassified Terrabacter TaxID=2630222 RepID=UPI0006FB0407|nr:MULTISPECIES: phenylacetic acid degradation protein PaaN [unclassified Terrabacter]KRC88819.1 aldehyde dehydrogenase [Terrabacter sp. Root85]KRF45703.1 aldehyde dehydrogenase [Terrabacter sp. Soil811]
MTAPATTPTHPLLDAHAGVLDEIRQALASRSWYSRYPESPSPRVYGETAAADGLAAHEAHLDGAYAALSSQPTDGTLVGSEVSPYGPTLGATYPALDVDAGLAAARAAMAAWRDAGPQVRAAVCVEIVDRINKRSFEIANAVMHTSGQPFVMSFQAGGPHAQDRAIEAIAAGLVEQERVPASVVWEKPGRDREGKPAPTRMQKDYRLVPRGVALVIGCNTFPTWNAYPGIFASLVTGNAVVVKPHPRAVLPLAISVEVARSVLAEAGFDPALVQLAAEADGQGLAKTLAERDEVAIIDYTGGPAFGAWLEESAAAHGKLVYTEKAGLNSIVVDSTDDLRGMLGNLAFSLTLYSGQMCTAPQNLYVPEGGVDTDEGHLTFDEFGERLAGAVGRLTGDDAKAVELLGATVNDQVRSNADSLASIAEDADGRVVLDSRRVVHPTWGDAVVRAPGLVAVDVAREDVYTQECFGPVGFLIRTASTEQSLAQLADTVREHGAMTAAVYSTSDAVLDAARDAAAEGGVALSENLTGQIFVNQTAAFSDFHGTGANPAANSAYTDAAFVANRFRVITSRRHV